MEGISFKKYGGIYYTDEVDFTTEIEAEIIAFTLDAGLIGLRIEQVPTRYYGTETMAIKGTK